MEYIKVSEAAAKWGLSARRVRDLCAEQYSKLKFSYIEWPCKTRGVKQSLFFPEIRKFKKDLTNLTPLPSTPDVQGD